MKQRGWRRVAKRAFDVVAAGVATGGGATDGTTGAGVAAGSAGGVCAQAAP